MSGQLWQITVHVDFAGCRTGAPETRLSRAGGIQQIEMAVMRIPGIQPAKRTSGHEFGTGIRPITAILTMFLHRIASLADFRRILRL